MRGFVCCIVAMLLCIATQSRAESPMGADIEFKTKLYDLGELSQGDAKQRVVVEYRNVGDVPLVVTEVRTSCSCTTVAYDRRKVMPGDVGQLIFTMDPSKAPVGSFYRVVQVFSTARSGVAYLTLKAEIK